MPWGVAAAVGAAAVGSAVSGAMAPSSSGGSGGPGSYYVPTGLQSADQQWQGLQTGNYNFYNANPLQQYGQQSLQQGFDANSQYAPGYQTAANSAGIEYGNLAQHASQQANLDFTTQQGLLGAGQNVYNMGLDPQNALYNRSVQQLQDQTGATNSMYGLGSSAAGAGVANQALGNFNIDWQNQQLQRAAQGLQSYGQAAGVAGQYGGAGLNAAASVPGYIQQMGATPYNTAQQIAAAPGQLGGAYGQYLNSNVYGPAQGIQGAATPYMNYGQGAQSVPYQNQMAGAGTAGALASQGISQLGSNPQVQSALGGMFGGNSATGSFSGGDFSGASNSSPYYSGGGNSYGFTM
jgi:hypothetical protein